MQLASISFRLLPIVFFLTVTQSRAEGTILINGHHCWLNGINIPWNHFGTDFGTHDEWGALHSHEFFDTTFAKYAAAGINCARVWVHGDGRSSPEFDAPGGTVTGLDDNFLTDFDDMMALAAKHHIFIMPVLWSFDMVKQSSRAGMYGGMCRPLIDNPEKTKRYIDNVLIPLVARYDNDPYLFSWEICNEPEWMVENHGVSRAAVQRFHAMIAAAIHAHSSKPVTTGAASLKWNSNHPDCTNGGGGFWWSDSALQAAFDDPGAYLDIYQVHFYEWMVPWYVPYTKDVAYWGDIGDRPVIIGETPGHDVNFGQFTMSLAQMYETAYQNGYCGVFAWSDKAKDEHGSWENIRAATQSFADSHDGLIDVATKTTGRAVRRAQGTAPAINLCAGADGCLYSIQGKKLDSGRRLAIDGVRIFVTSSGYASKISALAPTHFHR